MAERISEFDKPGVLHCSGLVTQNGENRADSFILLQILVAVARVIWSGVAGV